MIFIKEDPVCNGTLPFSLSLSLSFSFSRVKSRAYTQIRIQKSIYWNIIFIKMITIFVFISASAFSFQKKRRGEAMGNQLMQLIIYIRCDIRNSEMNVRMIQINTDIDRTSRYMSAARIHRDYTPLITLLESLEFHFHFTN